MFDGNINAEWDTPNRTDSGNAAWADPGLEADLSDATAATINQIREAFQIQKLFERDARGGTRYTEILRSHFGISSPDSRLQRPEWLGGGTTQIMVNPVPQTSEADLTPEVAECGPIEIKPRLPRPHSINLLLIIQVRLHTIQSRFTAPEA